MTKAFKAAVADLPYNQTIFDERGVRTNIIQGNSQVQEHQRRNQFKKPGSN
jgi:hypothetical protein